MKKIGDFLFVEQCFADIEETKPCIININAIDSITQSYNNKHGNVAVIETDNAKIVCKKSREFLY